MDDHSGDVPFIDRSTVAEKAFAIVRYPLDTNDMMMWTNPAYTPANRLGYPRPHDGVWFANRREIANWVRP